MFAATKILNKKIITIISLNYHFIINFAKQKTPNNPTGSNLL